MGKGKVDFAFSSLRVLPALKLRLLSLLRFLSLPLSVLMSPSSLSFLSSMLKPPQEIKEN